jgi:hypothetical protein
MTLTRTLCLAILLGVLCVSTGWAADAPGPWKVRSQLKVPVRIDSTTISDDNKLIFLGCTGKTRMNTGGINPGIFESRHLRAYDTGTGKELTSGILLPSSRVSFQANRLALLDGSDNVQVYDAATWKLQTKIDTRSNPPKGGLGRFGDFTFTLDGKTLVTIGTILTEKKLNPTKTGWVVSGFEQVVFWDAEKGTRLSTLDSDDKELRFPTLTFLAKRNQILVTFENGLRLLDPLEKKWLRTFPVQDVGSARVSLDETAVVVTDHDQGVKVFALDTGKQVTAFTEKVMNEQMNPNRAPKRGPYQFSPVARYVDSDRYLHITLNDKRTVVFRDAHTGALAKRPASEALTFPGGAVRILAVSRDGLCAVTQAQGTSGAVTVWHREPTEKSSGSTDNPKE